MPTVMKFNPKDNASIIRFLESLDTVDSVLENSSVIIASDVTTKRDVLENVIRHEDLTMEQLSVEKHKIMTAMNLAVTKNIPVIEANQQSMVNLSNLIDHKINVVDDPKVQVVEDMIQVYEHELFDCEEPQSYSVRTIHNDVITENMEVVKRLDSTEMITPTGIRECFMMICDPVYKMNDNQKKVLEMAMYGKIMNTLEYEMANDKYHDLPIIEAVNLVKKSMDNRYFDKEPILESVDALYTEIIESIKEVVGEDFNPNPYSNIYDMAPFDVGARNIMRTMEDLINAETDEEIQEALLHFGRQCKVCEVYGPVTEKQGFIKKGARKLARKSQRLTAKLRGKHEDAKDVGVALKKTVDPMSKFIDGIVDKFHKADMNERRNVIIKGGIWPKIVRWLKRAIALIIAGSFGEVGAVIAAITLLTFVATDVSADAKAKTNILHELESELEIVNEKIEDSRSAEDKQNKYKLMRIRAKLQKDIDRIQLGLNY